MPIYEFKCQKCNDVFDELVMNSDAIKYIKCPQCHTHEISRMMSAFGFSSDSTSSYEKSGKSCSSCSSKQCSTCH